MAQPVSRDSVEQFVLKWSDRGLTERASSHVHFVELCQVLGVPYPHENPAHDDEYCFDALTATAGSQAYADAVRNRARGVAEGPDLFGDGDDEAAPATRVVAAKREGHGFADVWKRGHFCWEYKRQGRHADLGAALEQLKRYRDSLENPPLLIVCDIDNYEIHTNFTGYPVETYRFTINDLASPSQAWRDRGESPLHLLRRAFTDPKSFRPRKSLSAVTEELAEKVGKIAIELGQRKGQNPHDVAHFLMQMVFCMFAEDVGLLPRDLLTKLLKTTHGKPKDFLEGARDLFRAMAGGGRFGLHSIDHFNGGLFRDIESQRFPSPTAGQVGAMSVAAVSDWSQVEPSILGTLFERSLDPGKRSQIGAHYTSREDILLVIEPVVMAPLRREWAAAQRKAARALAAGADAKKKKAAVDKPIRAFADRLASVRILDPACGSGNFLYVAIQQLLDLEKEVINFGARPEVGVKIPPQVGPAQLRGLEINPYAAELARVSVWIGYLKWQRENGVISDRRPILDALDTIECRDAILDLSNPKKPKPARWPEADFIIGNPPFLGSKLFRKWGMQDDYLEALYSAYDLPNTSDLCCYWFELARRAIEKGKGVRAGLLATQGIRGGDNRTVLKRIKETGDIFSGWSDREWILDGAAVHVSIVGFDDGSDATRMLDGKKAAQINSNLTDGADMGAAVVLPENRSIAFMGDTKGGAFDIDMQEAMEMLASPNPNNRSNAEVVRPWVNGMDITRRPRGMFIIDYGCDMPVEQASQYEAPFASIERLVLPSRTKIRQEMEASRWWLHVRPRQEMRQALPQDRFLATPTLTKYRLFTWALSTTLPDHQLIAYARDDDYFFGALHSSVHELWARRMGTQLEDRPRYTPTTCFETFPLPWAPGAEPVKPRQKGHAQWKAVSAAAARLNELRENWLNPPEWIAQMEKQVEIRYREALAAVPAEARELVKRSAVMAEAAKHPQLKKRTLTNLYNERPAWLRLAHKALDEAVLAAYALADPEGGWDPAWAAAYEPYGAGEIEVKPSGRTGKKKGKKRAGAKAPADAAARAAAVEARRPVDEAILANLLRLNGERAAP